MTSKDGIEQWGIWNEGNLAMVLANEEENENTVNSIEMVME